MLVLMLIAYLFMLCMCESDNYMVQHLSSFEKWKLRIAQFDFDSTIILLHNKVPKSWGRPLLSHWTVKCGYRPLFSLRRRLYWLISVCRLAFRQGYNFQVVICSFIFLLWFNLCLSNLCVIPLNWSHRGVNNIRPWCSTSNNFTIYPRLVLICRPWFQEHFFPLWKLSKGLGDPLVVLSHWSSLSFCDVFTHQTWGCCLRGEL